ncbi:capsule biosynthesis protein [Roseomonas sp. GC11]|uniref:capsule biosynthesis protein n=1 Tax=Roseomonas sp. GC11 TaxID=2950546 RepID=UPI00210CE741|nr:capsule biosynthesis protein [Roseomonas sp. GC11]
MTDAASRPAAASAVAAPAAPRNAVPRRRGWLWRRRFYMLLVVLPTLLAALYLYGIAAGQYASEARFLVSGGTARASSSSGISELISSAGYTAIAQNVLAVRDYLQSPDALDALVENINLIDIYRRPEADLPAMLWMADPPKELLLLYHNSMTTLTIDSTSGIITLRSRAFRADDARTLVEEQLRLAENFVNRLSDRAREEALRIARAELRIAEQRVRDSQTAVATWRQRERAVDPQSNAQIGMNSLSALEAQLTTARAELQEKLAFLRGDNPQIQLLRNRIGSLEREIREHRQRLTLGADALPEQMATYERLLLERDFADKQLASATASLELARQDAQRQQLFVTRVVQPGIAELPLYPRAGLIVVSMFLLLSVLYGIGWMMMTGMREHAF